MSELPLLMCMTPTVFFDYETPEFDVCDIDIFIFDVIIVIFSFYNIRFVFYKSSEQPFLTFDAIGIVY